MSTGDGVGRDLADQGRYGVSVGQTACALMADDANLEEPAGRVFRQVGARGPSKSADNMRKKGLNHFERFLSEKRLPPYEDLSPDLITIELFQEFGGYYLCFDAEKKDLELFAWESIAKFISGVK